MPNKLKKGKSKKTMDANFHELRHGETFRATSKKKGKKKAQKQMVAIVLDKAGLSRKPKVGARKKRRGGR